MIEKYFEGHKESEAELGVEIKRCLKEYVLTSSGPMFFFIEFHDFELTPKRIFEFKSKNEFDDFDNKNALNHRPRLIIEKDDSFFAEFNGNEIHLSFEPKDNDVSMELFFVMPYKRNA